MNIFESTFLIDLELLNLQIYLSISLFGVVDKDVLINDFGSKEYKKIL